MLQLVEIEFELKKGGMRKANVIGKDNEDVYKYIMGFESSSKINNIGFQREIHAYTDYAIDYLKGKLEIEDPKTTETEIPNMQMETTQGNRYICPWCERDFEKALGLKMHIKKTHEPKKESVEENPVDKEIEE